MHTRMGSFVISTVWWMSESASLLYSLPTSCLCLLCYLVYCAGSKPISASCFLTTIIPMAFCPPAGTETVADLNAYLAARYSLPPSSSLDHPTPSPGPASSKVVPPHPTSPPAAPPAQRQKSGAPEGPSVAPLPGFLEPSVFDIL